MKSRGLKKQRKLVKRMTFGLDALKLVLEDLVSPIKRHALCSAIAVECCHCKRDRHVGQQCKSVCKQ